MGDADWLDLEFLADDDRRCQRCGTPLGPNMVSGIGVEARFIEFKSAKIEGPQPYIAARCPDCDSNLVFDSVMDRERLLNAVGRFWDELDERARRKAESLGVTQEVVEERARRIAERIRAAAERALKQRRQP